MCDCKTLIEGKMLEMFVDGKPDGAEHEIKLEGYGFCLNRESNQIELKPFMPAVGCYTHTFKNGNKKKKKVEQNIFFNYCPFCGESIGTGTVVPGVNG